LFPQDVIFSTYTNYDIQIKSKVKFSPQAEAKLVIVEELENDILDKIRQRAGGDSIRKGIKL
jgi:hypothetical protein